VAQAVGVDTLLDPGAGREAGEEAAHVARGDRLALERAEEWSPTRQAERAAAVEPALEQREGGRVHADRAALVALAVEHGDGAGGLVDVLGVERERL